MTKFISIVRIALSFAFCVGAVVYSPTTSFAAVERDLRVVEIGTWVNNSDEIFYIRVDREIGDSACRSNLIKVVLNDTAAQDANAETVRELSTAALLSGRRVRVNTDGCLYGNPTINTLYLVAD